MESNTDTRFSDNPRIHKLIEQVVGELKMFTEDQARHINDLVRIGSALSAERDLDRILEMILAQARRFTNADGGTLYLLAEDCRSLAFNVMHTDSLKIYQGGTSGNTVNLPNVPLYDAEGNENHSNVSAHVALSGQVINIADVYEAKGFNFDGPRRFDESLNYRSMSMLVVPMRDHEGEIIGVLQLINACDDKGNTIPFAPELESMTHALASQAAVALTQQRLISDLKNLFESFIEAIATAIDEKSKYTGGHIARVTELTMMIAQQINATGEGEFADLSFSEDELEELRIATWLHDTGKITTPEFVVDKANKLETVFDRIELVRTRWQAIRLARRLDALNKLLASVDDKVDPELRDSILAEMNDDLAILDEDLAFLTTTNKGGEFMVDEKIDRLKAIAANRYDTGSGENESYLTEDEVYNLAIRKGTLTDEEREIMNNHVVMSIKILEQLPWPRKMSNVPAIAGAHHEKLDGTGYPNGWKEDEISLQGRIMAVADVFEALSAKDRPYKDPMPLSQAIKILGFMVKDNHLDGRIVDLFVQSGLVKEYAEKHLAKDQIDL